LDKKKFKVKPKIKFIVKDKNGKVKKLIGGKIL